MRTAIFVLLLSASVASCDNSNLEPDESEIPLTHPFSHNSGDYQSSANVGIWMFYDEEGAPSLTSDAIADWRDSPQDILEPINVNILEPINVVWIDYTASSQEESRQNVADYLTLAGFEREGTLFHTSGYWGWYDGGTVQRMVPQWPMTDAWVDEKWPAENNHGRVFAVANVGTVANPVFYTLGAFSRETEWDLLGATGHDFAGFLPAQQKVLGGATATTGDTVFGWTYERFDTDWGNRLDVQTTFDHAGVALLLKYPEELGALYTGSGTLTNTECTDPVINTTFQTNVRIEITRTGSEFTGTMTATFTFQGFTFTPVDQMTGTITGNRISGIIVGRLLDTTSRGTFEGELSGNTLSLSSESNDTSGETCRTVGQVTATLDTM